MPAVAPVLPTISALLDGIRHFWHAGYNKA
jgi:hypothetical protein